MARKKKEPEYVYFPASMPWVQKASERSKAVWEKRWEQAFYEGGKLGKKGEAYIEQKYGPVVGGGGGERVFDEEWPEDLGDFSDEEEDTPES